jgi:DNA-directed RNA polymerase subunit K/omega
MTQPDPEFDSIFRYIVVVSQRAEQIINGAKVRSETRHVKPTLQALDDVQAGLVQWRVLTQEELDAQRQAIVDQFRAEVGADRIQADDRPRLRDVLPTRPPEVREEPAEPEPEERDEELGRLQRLLGIGERGHEPVAEEEEVAFVEEDEFALDLEEEDQPLEEEEEEVGDKEFLGGGEPGFIDEDEPYIEDPDIEPPEEE